VSVSQAKELEDAGCDGLYIGVGGGGRCITGNVANLAIDWPQLLWSLRGRIKIPVIVQGGANDNPATAGALGGSGIGAVGAMGGSLESPGGTLYFYDPKTGEIFKFYGGEASNRMRVMANRKDPLGRTINKEGEATRKPFKNEPDQGVYTTAQQRLAEMLERISTGLVFQNVRNIIELQDRTEDILREAPIMSLSRNPHDTHR
jgi:hypothetical protein